MKKVLEIFKNKTLTDILMLGYTAREDSVGFTMPRSTPANALYFAPDRNIIYLNFGDVYVKFTTDDSTLLLTVEPCAELIYSFPIENDDDLSHANSSYFEIFLPANRESYSVTQAQWFYSDDSQPEDGKVDALELTINGKYLLFFDPWTLGGIDVSGDAFRRDWEENQLWLGKNYQVAGWPLGQ